MRTCYINFEDINFITKIFKNYTKSEVWEALLIYMPLQYFRAQQFMLFTHNLQCSCVLNLLHLTLMHILQNKRIILMKTDFYSMAPPRVLNKRSISFAIFITYETILDYVFIRVIIKKLIFNYFSGWLRDIIAATKISYNQRNRALRT